VVAENSEIVDGRNQPSGVVHSQNLYDCNRCRPVSNFSVASVSNTDGMPPIERQLYGTSTVKIFLPPESCHPGAPASGRQEILAVVDPMTAPVRHTELHRTPLLTFISNGLFLMNRFDFSSKFLVTNFALEQVVGFQLERLAGFELDWNGWLV
jgi:hypothetical protein